MCAFMVGGRVYRFFSVSCRVLAWIESMKSCCLTCEHGEAVERENDFVLCCMLEGEENPKEVSRDHVCKDFNTSMFADVVLLDETL